MDRARYMISIAESCLADVSLKDTDKPGFKRYIKRTPLGVVLVIAPWKSVSLYLPNGTPAPILTARSLSYPYLVSINVVLPAIIAGNSVLLKPSPQTPLTAERFALALTRAGVPSTVIQVVHLSPKLTEYAIKHPKVDFVSFTGSVTGGKFVQEVASHADGFKGVALEVCFV